MLHFDTSVKEIVRSQTKNVVIVGENGSGKSFLLNKIARYYALNEEQVIAVANTVYDKFNRRGARFEFIGSRQGRQLPERTIKKALMGSIDESLRSLRRIARVLDYVGYRPAIGFRLKGFVGVESAKKILELDPIRNDTSGGGWYDYYFPDFMMFGLSTEDITWINLDEDYFTGIPGQVLELLNIENSLKKAGVLKKIEIYLVKDKKEIPVADASSGEITLLSTLLFISAKAKEEACIVIDEPENSLHPAWQRDYFYRLLDLFSYYDLKVIVATHSPLIVTGAAESMSSISIYRSEFGKVFLLNHEKNNLEEILIEVFKVSTPENRYLSNKVKALLNMLAENESDLESVLLRLDELKMYGFKEDRAQREMLEGIKELAIKISRRR